MSLALALVLHVVDEAVNDFLPFYNSIVRSIPDPWSWIPLPTFSFQEWIIGLAVGLTIMLALSPLVFAGNRFLRPVSYVLGVMMVGNALGHVGASFYLARMVPGVLSSPVVLVAAVFLLISTYRCRTRSD